MNGLFETVFTVPCSRGGSAGGDITPLTGDGRTGKDRGLKSSLLSESPVWSPARGSKSSSFKSSRVMLSNLETGASRLISWSSADWSTLAWLESKLKKNYHNIIQTYTFPLIVQYKPNIAFQSPNGQHPIKKLIKIKLILIISFIKFSIDSKLNLTSLP